MVRLDNAVSQGKKVRLADATVLIRRGEVSVDGVVVCDPAWQVILPLETLMVTGTLIEAPDSMCRIFMLHKPAGVTSTNEKDPAGRPNVLDLVPPEHRMGRLGIYGRLDADTTGLMLLGTDGGIGQLLHHPSTRIEKTYVVTLKQRPGHPSVHQDIEARFEKGMVLNNGQQCAPAQVELLRRSDEVWGLRIRITEGMHHQVKKMVGSCGGHVTALHREAIGGLHLAGTVEGGCRPLSGEELKILCAMLPSQRIVHKKKQAQREEQISASTSGVAAGAQYEYSL